MRFINLKNEEGIYSVVHGYGNVMRAIDFSTIANPEKAINIDKIWCYQIYKDIVEMTGIEGYEEGAEITMDIINIEFDNYDPIFIGFTEEAKDEFLRIKNNFEKITY